MIVWFYFKETENKIERKGKESSWKGERPRKMGKKKGRQKFKFIRKRQLNIFLFFLYSS